MVMTRLTLVRHAESAMNRSPHLVGGRSNSTPLMERGRQAALRARCDVAGRAARDRGAQRSGPLTADGSVPHRGAGWQGSLICEEGLQELSQGIAEGQPRELWWTAGALEAMRADPAGHRLSPGGESHEEVQARMRDAVQRLASCCRGGYVVAVGHGIAMRTLAWSLLGGALRLPEPRPAQPRQDRPRRRWRRHHAPRHHRPTDDNRNLPARWHCRWRLESFRPSDTRPRVRKSPVTNHRQWRQLLTPRQAIVKRAQNTSSGAGGLRWLRSPH